MAKGIEIKIGLDTTQAESQLKAFGARFKSAIDSNTASITSLKSAVVGLGSAFAAIGALNFLKDVASRAIDAAREIDRMRSTLTALTGSAEAARKRFAELVAIAQKTPGLTASLAVTLDTQLRVLNATEKTINRLLPVIGKLNAIAPLGNPQQFVNNLTQLVTQNFERQDLKELVGQSPIAGQIIKELFNVDNPTNAEAIRASAKKLGITSVETFAAEFIKAAEANPALKNVIENLGSRFDKLEDRLKIALAPIGEELAKVILPLFEDLIRAVEEFGPIAAKVFQENKEDIIEMARALASATVETGRFISKLAEIGQAIGLFGTLNEAIRETALMAATAADLLSGDLGGTRTRQLADRFRREDAENAAVRGSPFLSSAPRTAAGTPTPPPARRTTAGGGGGGTRRRRSRTVAGGFEPDFGLNEAEALAREAELARISRSNEAVAARRAAAEVAEGRPAQLAAFNAATTERLRQIDIESLKLQENTAKKAKEEAEEARKALEKIPPVLSASERFARGFASQIDTVGDAFERFGANVSNAFRNVRDLFNGLKQAVLGFFRDILGSALQNLVRGTLEPIFSGFGGLGGGNVFRTPSTFPAAVGSVISGGGGTGGGGFSLGGIFSGGKFNFGQIGESLLNSAPLLGFSLGGALGGQSIGGNILGSAGGLLASTFLSTTLGAPGALGSLAPALFSNPFTAIAGAGLLVGAVLLGKAKQRKKDEETSGQMLTAALQGITQLRDAVAAGQVDGSQARAIFENQILGQFIQGINSLKTKSVRESRLTNQVADLRKVFNDVIPPAVAAQTASREKAAGNALTHSRIIPEFATGGTTLGGLALLHPGEKVLNLHQQAAVIRQSNPRVFERAGVPGANQNRVFDVGGTMPSGSLGQSIVINELHIDAIVDAEGIHIRGARSESGRRVTVNNINLARKNREL